MEANVSLPVLCVIRVDGMCAKWLKLQDAYTLYAPFVRHFHRRPTIVSELGIQLQADLINVSSHFRHNGSVHFFSLLLASFLNFHGLNRFNQNVGKMHVTNLQR